MFDFFGRRTAKEYMTEAKEKYGLPDPDVQPVMPEIKAPKKELDDDGYTIGPGTDGYCTTLKMKSGYSTITLQMNEVGVKQMIKLLAATLPTPTEEQ